MTDKPIIIDGVDVSGCDFLAKEDDYCSYSGEYRYYKGQCGCSDEEMCKDHPNCFYKKALKQLQRKTQVEAKLVDQIQTICDFINNRPATFKGVYGDVAKIITEYAAHKEKECEELKEEVDLLRQYKGSKQASYESMQVEKNKAVSQNRDLLKQVEGWQEKYNKLEAERDKIKAIGDNYFDEFEMCCLNLPDAIDSLLKRYDHAFIRLKKAKECEVEK